MKRDELFMQFAPVFLTDKGNAMMKKKVVVVRKVEKQNAEQR